MQECFSNKLGTFGSEAFPVAQPFVEFAPSEGQMACEPNQTLCNKTCISKSIPCGNECLEENTWNCDNKCIDTGAACNGKYFYPANIPVNLDTNLGLRINQENVLWLVAFQFLFWLFSM